MPRKLEPSAAKHAAPTDAVAGPTRTIPIRDILLMLETIGLKDMTDSIRNHSTTRRGVPDALEVLP
jgi:hypothetical protein